MPCPTSEYWAVSRAENPFFLNQEEKFGLNVHQESPGTSNFYMIIYIIFLDLCLIIFDYVCICMSVLGCVHVSAGARSMRTPWRSELLGVAYIDPWT